MIPPCQPLAGFDMDHAFSADGGHGGCIEREHAFHGFVCVQLWILGARMHHVEGDVGLFEVFAPVGQSLGGRSACSDGEKMVLPHSDGAFSWVSSMNV